MLASPKTFHNHWLKIGHIYLFWPFRVFHLTYLHLHMRKKEKHPSTAKSPSVGKNEPDASLELLLDQDLNQQLAQTARRQEIPLEKIILEILTERFKKS